MSIKAVLWMISVVISIFLFASIYYIWNHSLTTYYPERDQLVNEEAVKSFLKTNWEDKFPEFGKSIYIPTGIYIQSLSFKDPYTVRFIGFIWQHYNKEKHQHITKDFFLPQAVDLSQEAKTLLTHYEKGDEELYLWHMEAEIKQEYSYLKYPLDHKMIKLQILPYNFDKDIILTPDFPSYPSTKLEDIYGIADHILLPGFRIRDTFFNYKLMDYKTNFGNDQYVGNEDFPELTYHIVLHRNVMQGVIFHLLPLIGVLIILFLLLLNIYEHQPEDRTFTFDRTAIFSTCSGLFFILVLSNINLREQFIGSNIVYIEYFYVIAYIAIILVAMNGAFLTKKSGFLLNYQNNLLPKVLYWPLILGAMLVISLKVI